MYYLDVPVEITDDPNREGKTADEFGPGWVNARWPQDKDDKKKDQPGKVYTHWRAQLRDAPWG